MMRVSFTPLAAALTTAVRSSALYIDAAPFNICVGNFVADVWRRE